MALKSLCCSEIITPGSPLSMPTLYSMGLVGMASGINTWDWFKMWVHKEGDRPWQLPCPSATSSHLRGSQGQATAGKGHHEDARQGAQLHHQDVRLWQRSLKVYDLFWYWFLVQMGELISFDCLRACSVLLRGRKILNSTASFRAPASHVKFWCQRSVRCTKSWSQRPVRLGWPRLVYLAWGWPIGPVG